MGTAFKIRCKHCGSLFNHSSESRLNLYIHHSAQPQTMGYIETEAAMRCPNCLRRLNTTPEEFNQQVETTSTH